MCNLSTEMRDAWSSQWVWFMYCRTALKLRYPVLKQKYSWLISLISMQPTPEMFVSFCKPWAQAYINPFWNFTSKKQLELAGLKVLQSLSEYRFRQEGREVKIALRRTAARVEAGTRGRWGRMSTIEFVHILMFLCRTPWASLTSLFDVLAVGVSNPAASTVRSKKHRDGQ